MLLIVFGHFCGQSNAMEFIDPHSATAVIVAILGNASRISVNLFLIVAVWFMVGREFKAERLIKTWITVFIWGGLSTIIAMICGVKIGIATLLQCFLPILGRPLWFASAYMLLYMCSPFLNRILTWERKSLRAFLFVLFLFCSLIPTITSFNETFSDSVLWFIFVYLFVGYIKLYCLTAVKHYLRDGLLGMMLYLVLVLIKHSSVLINGRIVETAADLANSWLVNYRSIPNFTCALLIFFFFNSLDFKSKIVNGLAQGSFPVYIVHQTKAFYPVLWAWLLNRSSSASGTYSILLSLVYISLFYLVITILETIRRKKLQVNKICFYSVIEKKLNDIF